MPHAPRLTLGRIALTTAAAAGIATTGMATATAQPTHRTPPEPLTVRTVLSGAANGWNSPDDLTAYGDSLFVAFQNGVPSTGGQPGTPSESTIVKFDLRGRIEGTWQVTGKCDGLGVDPRSRRVIATVNEDGNSSLYTIPAVGSGAATHYSYDASPLPHGGGTDSVVVDRGHIYITASAPTNLGPAVYEVSLQPGGVAHLVSAPFYDSSSATVANPGGGQVNLALTDPDSSTLVPRHTPRFGGDFMLDSQGDQQLIFARDLGGDDQQLQVLNLSQSVDDVAFPTRRSGVLVTADAAADSIDVITGTFTPGTAYTAVTPSGANTPPVPTPANYLGTIDLNTGAVTPLTTAGVAVQPHSLIYLPSSDEPGQNESGMDDSHSTRRP